MVAKTVDTAVSNDTPPSTVDFKALYESAIKDKERVIKESAEALAKSELTIAHRVAAQNVASNEAKLPSVELKDTNPEEYDRQIRVYEDAQREKRITNDILARLFAGELVKEAPELNDPTSETYKTVAAAYNELETAPTTKLGAARLALSMAKLKKEVAEARKKTDASVIPDVYTESSERGPKEEETKITSSELALLPRYKGMTKERLEKAKKRIASKVVSVQ